MSTTSSPRTITQTISTTTASSLLKQVKSFLKNIFYEKKYYLQYKHHYLGPTSVHLHHEFILWISYTLHLIASYTMFYKQSFGSTRYDYLVIFLSSLWLGRFLILRILCTTSTSITNNSNLFVSTEHYFNTATSKTSNDKKSFWIGVLLNNKYLNQLFEVLERRFYFKKSKNETHNKRSNYHHHKSNNAKYQMNQYSSLLSSNNTSLNSPFSQFIEQHLPSFHYFFLLFLSTVLMIGIYHSFSVQNNDNSRKLFFERFDRRPHLNYPYSAIIGSNARVIHSGNSNPNSFSSPLGVSTIPNYGNSILGIRFHDATEVHALNLVMLFCCRLMFIGIMSSIGFFTSVSLPFLDLVCSKKMKDYAITMATRLLEAMYICVYLPQCLFTCQVTHHCPINTTTFDNQDASLEYYHSILKQPWLNFVLYTSIVIVSVHLLLSQMMVLDRGYFSSSSVYLTNSQNTQKKDILMKQQRTSKRNGSNNTASVPSQQEEDPGATTSVFNQVQQTISTVFSKEVSHASTSQILLFISISQWIIFLSFLILVLALYVNDVESISLNLVLLVHSLLVISLCSGKCGDGVVLDYAELQGLSYDIDTWVQERKCY